MAEHKTLQDEDNEFNQPLWKRMKYTTDKKDGKITEDPDKLVWTGFNRSWYRWNRKIVMLETF